MSARGQNTTQRRGQSGGAGRGGRTPSRRVRTRPLDNEGIIPVLAKAVREVEAGVQRRSLPVDGRTKFQVVAMLAREERARVKADTTIAEAARAEQLKRLDGIGTILAKTATQEPSFFELLDEHAELSDAARSMRRAMLAQAGIEVAPDTTAADAGAAGQPERRVVPRSVVARQLANPFQVPDFSSVRPVARPQLLASWELLDPLFRSFEKAGPGAPACMELPEPRTLTTRSGKELMLHQAQLVTAAAQGHRTFLLADEPGLGKTAQSLLAAEAADAYPLLVVVPNVVKTNWARETKLWTPRRTATVVQGDGHTVDGFADVVVVNYEVLDRHAGWLGDFGFRGMVVDEAHFIKNKKSQRSQHVLQIADRIRSRCGNPLMMALTGTPLINDIEDFRAIWQLLGWIDDSKPLGSLMIELEELGRTPLDPAFYAGARQAVVHQGIVRRRKVDVAADIPARRVADIPVELDDAVGRSIRESERQLAQRLLARYDASLAARRRDRAESGVLDTGRGAGDEIDLDLVRRVAAWEREDTDNGTAAATTENVFSMMRRIGRAKAELAADYTAQLARNVGKVVFFAKHVDVMDAAQELFEARGIRYSSIRGDQTPGVRQAQVDAFTDDPEVAVAVCSLTAAGVGLNLQVASDVVLAELSWTDAEQTQAIDRVHRIGQDQPVTAWRIIAAQTIDSQIAELIDAKAGLAARALDGSDAEVTSSVDVQVQALTALLLAALQARASRRKG